LKRIKGTIRIISILTGALFFLLSPAYSRSCYPTADSILQADTIKTSILYESETLKIQDSLQTGTTVQATAIIDTNTTIVEDTIIEGSRKRKIPSPQRATILSAVIPGLGQAYNHKYWKIPVIYSIGVGLYFYYDYKNDIYLDNKRWYNEAEPDDPNRDTYDNDRNDALTKRGYAVIFMGILYFANVIDAMTDAYFLQYDISEDLSVDIRPTLIPEFYHPENYYSYGVSINIHF